MKFLSFEKKDKIGILKINRPEALNALNKEILLELRSFLRKQIKDEDIRVLILSGTGEKAFVAGADIKAMNEYSNDEILKFGSLGQSVTNLLATSDCVTIAAVNGFALGGGLELALACDFIYASENAKLGLPETSLGVIPGFGGTQRLARAVGTRLAKEMIFTGKLISADEALKINLVNQVVAQDELLNTVEECANKILKNSFNAIISAKQAINDGYNTSIQAGLEIEKMHFALSFNSEDRKEGMTAFIEKRKAKFN